MNRKWILSELGFWSVMIITICYTHRDDLGWKTVATFAIVIPIIFYWKYKTHLQNIKRMTDSLIEEIPLYLKDDEDVLLTSFCTYQTSWIGIEGMLFLTNKRICFIPDNVKFDNKSFFHNLDLVKEAKIVKSKILKSNKLSIQTNDNQTFNLWMQEPSLWIPHLTSNKYSLTN